MNVREKGRVCPEQPCGVTALTGDWSLQGVGHDL